MSEGNQVNSQRSRDNTALLMLLIGAGLILIGALVWMAQSKAKSTPIINPSGVQSPNSAIPATVNFPAPSLELTNLEGQTVSLADYLGQVVLVNNWATWCPPCRAEMPSMQAFFETHKDQDFTIIAISSGDLRDDVQSFVRENGLTFPIWIDTTSQALVAFRNHSLPSSYVIDQDGKIRLAWTGAISLKKLETYVTPLLEE